MSLAPSAPRSRTRAAGPWPFAAVAGNGPTTDEQRLQAFVREYIESVANNNVATQARFFASQVNFYDRGVLGRQQVQKTTEQYHNEWPVRRWTAEGKPEITGGEPDQYQVRQPFRWTVSNGSQDNRGSAVLCFVVQKDSKGGFRIVSVKQVNR
ncbi:MAG: hypothetical protein JO069_06370 [Verrucomicrobia bacterium]|nr:hypothetical protein [Verrucomicrobiota bacterium]